MPSEDKGSDGEKHTGFSEIVKNIDGNAKAIGLIKRFFNQVLGIYVPALIFIIYIWIIMQESGRQYIFGILPHFMKHQQYISIVLIIFLAILLGEAINAFTSRISILSPVKLTLKQRLLFIITGKTFPIWSKSAIWPLWMDETNSPVSFATFDRY
jgi:hypothetical protein